jgi:hypothetical protein
MNLSAFPGIRRPRSFVPRLEALEQREVPTCTITLQGTRLQIVGSASTDRVLIGDNGAGQIAVLCDNQRTPRLFNNITTISVNLLGGTDEFRYDLINSLTVPRNVNVNLGPGNDICQVFMNDFELLFGASMAFDLRGGGGNDRMTFNTGDDPDTATFNIFLAALGAPPTQFNPVTNNFGASDGTDVPTGTTLTCRIDGGTQSDQISVNYTGIIQGNVNFDLRGGGNLAPFRDLIQFDYTGTIQGRFGLTVDGGPGPDTIIINFALNNVSNGFLNARVQGGAANDNIRMNLRGLGTAVAPSGLRTDARIDGGPGRADRCQVSGNVQVINCEL